MARTLTTEQIVSIWANRHLPQRDNARLAGCSVGMISKVLKGAEPGVSESIAEPEPTAQREPVHVDEVVLAEQLVAGGASSEAELRGILARLQKAGRVAEEGRDVARTVSVERVSMQVLALLERIKPAPPVDHDAHPDMIAAAARFRTTIEALFIRIVDEALKAQP